jgi:hypothetical protein
MFIVLSPLSEAVFSPAGEDGAFQSANFEAEVLAFV